MTVLEPVNVDDVDDVVFVDGGGDSDDGFVGTDRSDGEDYYRTETKNDDVEAAQGLVQGVHDSTQTNGFDSVRVQGDCYMVKEADSDGSWGDGVKTIHAFLHMGMEADPHPKKAWVS